MERFRNDLGYVNNLTGVAAARVSKTLNKLVRFEGKVFSRIEYIILLVLRGFLPVVTKNYSYYSVKTGEKTKPKTLYTMEHNNESGKSITVLEVTKTEFDFANWLIDNNIVTIEAAEEMEQKEQQRIKNLEDEKIKAEEEKRDKLNKAREEEQNFNLWLQSAVNNLIAISDYRIDIVKNIFLDVVGTCSGFALETIVLVDNIFIDNKCKKELINRLNYHNIASKKAFYHLTGIKLPKTDRETKELLLNLAEEDIKNPIEYKMNAGTNQGKNEGEFNIYYIKMATGEYEEVKGYKLENKYNLELFYHELDGKYKITHMPTGISVINGIDRKEDIINNLEEVIKSNGIDKLKEIFNDAISQYGTVPNYHQQEQEQENPIEVVKEKSGINDAENAACEDYTVSVVRLDTMTDKDFKDIVIEGINDSDDMPFGTALDYLNANIFNPNYPCRYYSDNGMEYLKTEIQDNIVLITHTGSNDGKLIYNMYINHEGDIKNHKNIVESEVKSIVESIGTGENDGEITTIEDYNYSMVNLSNMISHVDRIKNFINEEHSDYFGSYPTQQRGTFRIEKYDNNNVYMNCYLHIRDEIYRFEKFGRNDDVIHEYINYLMKYQLDYKRYIETNFCIKNK